MRIIGGGGGSGWMSHMAKILFSVGLSWSLSDPTKPAAMTTRVLMMCMHKIGLPRNTKDDQAVVTASVANIDYDGIDYFPTIRYVQSSPIIDHTEKA